MDCPKCKTAELVIEDGNNKGTCLKCGGLWIEKYTQETFIELENYLTKGHANPDHDSVTGLCPNGHGILIRAKVDSKPYFFLEKCPQCFGIWFDKNEWQKISKDLIEQNLLEIWSVVWQKQQREVKQKSNINAVYKEKLGSELYSLIVQLGERVKNHPEKHRAISLLNEQLR